MEGNYKNSKTIQTFARLSLQHCWQHLSALRPWVKRTGAGTLFFIAVAIIGLVANLETLVNLPLIDNQNSSPSSTPAVLTVGTEEEATAFAEPILASIANAPPDLEDDFSTENERWQWELEEPSDIGTMQIQDGVLRISGLLGRVKVHADSLSGIGDFVLKVDARLVVGGSTSWQRIRSTSNSSPGPCSTITPRLKTYT